MVHFKLTLFTLLLCLLCGTNAFGIEDNALLYKTYNDEKFDLKEDAFGEAKVVSHTYQDGVGKITFDRDLTTIGDGAFYVMENRLTSITLPSGITTIGEGAFKYSELTSIILPSGITTIGEGAFKDCYDLESITFPKNLTTMGKTAFENCVMVKSIDLSATKLTEIQTDAFGGCSSLESVTFPSTLTKIGENAFIRCTSLKNITLNEGLTTIVSHAFGGCTSLENVILPSSLIELNGFTSCTSLKNISIPENVTEIGGFDGCTSIENIYIPEGVSRIDHFSFSGCTKLASIYIPSSVTEIQQQAFTDCSSLKDITMNIEKPIKLTQDPFSGMSESDRKAITLHVPDGTKKLYENSEWNLLNLVEFQPYNKIYYTSTDGKVVTPNAPSAFGDAEIVSNTYENGQGVIVFNKDLKEVGDYSFYACQTLKSISFPESVTTIGYSSFALSSIESITIPKSVKKIDTNTFMSCHSLKNMTVDWDEPLEISSNIFNKIEDLSKINLTVPNGAVELYNAANVWKDLTISETLYNNKIYYTSTDEKTVTPNASSAFGDAEIVSNTYENGQGVIVFNKDLKEVGDYSFYACQTLKSISFPESVTTIGYSSFALSSIESITIPKSVKKIDTNTFMSCHSLKNMTVDWDEPLEISSNIFNKIEDLSKITVIVPDGTVQQYKAARTWSSLNIKEITAGRKIYYTTTTGKTAGFNIKSVFAIKNTYENGQGVIVFDRNLTEFSDEAARGWSSFESIILPEGITVIGSYAFTDCSSLKEIHIPSSVTTIYDKAFSGCSSLTNITIPEGVTTIEDYAFVDCISLASVNIPQSVTVIKEGAFMRCSLLTNIAIPESVTEIRSFAFDGCSSLASIAIPQGITSILEYTFHDCASLEDITIPQEVTSIHKNAFEGCSSLTNVTIPSSVTTIYDKAFSGCSSLTSITIPKSVTGIGEQAFAGCSSLTSITFPNIQHIGSGMFKDCTSLTSFTIPTSVFLIDPEAFKNCSSLKDITVNWDWPISISPEVFSGIDDLSEITLHVPNGKTERYKDDEDEAKVWKEMNIVDDAVTSIKEVKTTPRPACKQLIDGRLIINHNGQKYNVAGEIVK